MSLGASGAASPDSRVVKQAILWMVRLAGNPAPELQVACERWRTSDAEHELAWQRVQALNQELRSSLQALPSPRLALETLDHTQQRLKRRQALKLLSAAAVGGSALWLARDLTPWPRWTADYATGVGERRQFQLADGSQLLLNTDSAVNVHFDARQRLLRLERGEIRLSTAEDARPLRVHSHEALFEALGARFVLRQERAETRLSVEQGAVAIAPFGLGHGSTVAEAGQSFRVTRLGAQAAAQQSMDSTAWADGMIVTRDMRLADFLAEVGRYRHGHVGCTDAVADLRLSGVYRLDDTDSLLDLLPRTLPVRVLRRTPWWITVEAHS